MSGKILQINFNFSGSRMEYEQVNLPYAQPISEIPGVGWKIWLMNEADHEAGGIYLFSSQAALQAFLTGPVVAELKQNPTVSALSIKQFDVLEEHTTITRGPIQVGAVA